MDITLIGVTKRFKNVEALTRVNLNIKDGELFTLLGPSGCGKTTTLRLIAGFYIPDEGKIMFGDREVQDIPPAKRNIGMVFQNYALWPHMTVYRNVIYGLQFKNVPKSDWQKIAQDALAKVGLTGYETRYPGQLSGGQQQRVALARALALNPDVLLLDEPLSNLDAKIRASVRAEIRKLQQNLGITTVYVTHDQEEALTLSDRIGIMNEGKLVQVGTPHDLCESPIPQVRGGFHRHQQPGGRGREVRKRRRQRRGCRDQVGVLRVQPRQRQGWRQVHRGVQARERDGSGQEAFRAGRPQPHIRQDQLRQLPGNTLRYEMETAAGIVLKADIGNPLAHEELSWGSDVNFAFTKSAALVIPDAES